MADMSTLSRRDPNDPDPEGSALLSAMTDNLSSGMAEALGDRLRDAENLWRYFCRRDEMNAEVHYKPDARPEDQVEANVRYTPITVAAERVCAYLARLYYGAEVTYSVEHSVIHEVEDDEREREKTMQAALAAAVDMRDAVQTALHPPPVSLTGTPFDVDPRSYVTKVAEAQERFERALVDIPREALPPRVAQMV